jgi:predicted membrane protein
MKRLATAMAAFAALSVIAAFILHGTALAAVLILFGYFAVRTLIAHKMRSQAEQDSEPIQNALSQSETPDPDSNREMNHT